jgi:hypothetical protein
MFVMVKCGVLFEVWTEFLNIIWMSFGFKGVKVKNPPNILDTGVKITDFK